MKKILPLFLLLSFGAFGLTHLLAQKPVYKSFTGVAIKGYDTVAFFNDSDAVKGQKAFQSKWNGAIWRFQSEANLKAFEANPEKYAPQYGGYCAWAMADGKKAPVDPNQWDITDGKLYLNYDPGIKAKWLEDKAGFIRRADAKWPSIKK